jgi:hypothetical protein
LIFTTKRTSVTIGAYFAFLIVPHFLVEMFAVFSPQIMRLRAFDIVFNIVQMAQMPEPYRIFQATALGAGAIVLATSVGIILFEWRDI